MFNYYCPYISFKNMKKHVTYLSTIDRYQGGCTTTEACNYLAQSISRCLTNGSVIVKTCNVHSMEQSLSFDAPKAWGLISASINFKSNDEDLLYLEHPNNPLCIGTNSHSFKGTARIVDYASETDFKKALILFSKYDGSFEDALQAVVDRGALGLVTNLNSRTIKGEAIRGRIEIPCSFDIIVISVTDHEFKQLETIKGDALTATIDLNTESHGIFSILEYSNNITSPYEIWVCAHICHPRPGANDNASGVATALELIRLFEDLDNAIRSVTVKFIISPEFTGITQYLKTHQKIPDLFINLDCVGGNKLLTGASLQIELPLPFLHNNAISKITAVLQNSMDKLHNQSLEIIPFQGYSDHAIFAAKCINVPAIMIGQSKDHYNHSDADTADKIDFDQMAWVAAHLHLAIYKISTDIEQYFSSRQPKNIDFDRIPESNFPFNLHCLLSRVSKQDAIRIKQYISKTKKTYKTLQLLWLSHQHNEASRDIAVRLFQEHETLDINDILYLEFIIKSVLNLEDNHENAH